MRQYIKEIGKHSTIYTISNILTKMIGVILIPIYTRFLTVEDYGIISIVTPLVSSLAILYTFGLNATLSRFYFDYDENSEQRKILIGNVVILLLLLSIFFNIIFFLSRSIFEKILPGIPFSPFIILSLLTASTFVLYDIKLTLFRVKQKSLMYGTYSVLRFLGIVTLTIITVVYYSLGAFGKIVSEFIMTLIFFIISCIVLYKEIIIKIDINLIKTLLKYAVPIIPHALAGSLIGLAGKVFLNYFDGLKSVGIYNIGFLIGSIMNLVVTSINLSWNPFFIKLVQEKKQEANPIISQLTTYYILFISFCALGLTFFGKEIIEILTTKDYHSASSIVPIIVFNYFITGLYFIAASKIFYIKKAVKLIPIATISSAIINIVLNYFLIPYWGIYGAAWSHFISNSICFIITYYISQKVFHINYEYKRLFILLILILSILLLFYLLQNFLNLNSIALILIKIGLLGFYFLVLFAFKFLRDSEIKNIKDIIHKVKSKYI